MVTVLQPKVDVTPVPTAVVQPATPVTPPSPVEKSDAPSTIERSKPEAVLPAPAAAITAESRGIDGGSFAVMDAGGYVRRLEDYRGYVVVIGVWSAEHASTLRNLDLVYKAIGSNPKARVLAVSNSRQSPPVNVTFPLLTNSNSQLLGLKESQFAVLDAAGVERMRGSLESNPDELIRSVQALLGN
jgi:hypothetical protein